MVATLPLVSTLAVIGQRTIFFFLSGGASGVANNIRPVLTVHNGQRDVSNALAVRQSTFDPSDLPSQCQSSCSVITQMTVRACDIADAVTS